MLNSKVKNLFCLLLFTIVLCTTAYANDTYDINAVAVAAENGNPEAQVELGKCFLNGYMIDQNLQQAAGWFAKAAQQQHPEGLYLTGYVFANGIGVEQDIPVAITVLGEAKEAGNMDAAVLLGDIAINGFGDTPPDYEAAISFYGPAAEANNADAIYALSHMLLEGQGMPKSIDDAKEGLAEAAKLGHTAACVDLAILIVETEEDNAANQDRVMDLLNFAAENGNEDAIELINEIMAE